MLAVERSSTRVARGRTGRPVLLVGLRAWRLASTHDRAFSGWDCGAVAREGCSGWPLATQVAGMSRTKEVGVQLGGPARKEAAD